MEAKNERIMYSPLFSILIANYNNGKYLMEAVRSVQAQTYTHWEIIIVDDGSTDESQSLYAALADDKRVRVYYNETNRGCGYTKRRCADLATGDLCGFLDPDDALTPDALQLMVAAHEAHPEVALIGSCYWCVDEDMKPMWHSEQKVLPPDGTWLTTTTTHAPIPFASYKGERYKKTEGINPDLKRAVDFDLYVKLEEQGGVMFLPDITYYYRQHDKQISTHGDFKSMYWQIYVIIKACERRHISAEKVVNDLMTDNWQWYIKNGVGYEVPKPKPCMLKRLTARVVHKCKKMFHLS